jgi:hypothetical protein
MSDIYLALGKLLEFIRKPRYLVKQNFKDLDKNYNITIIILYIVKKWKKI